jgi:hypothetical protein
VGDVEELQATQDRGLGVAGLDAGHRQVAVEGPGVHPADDHVLGGRAGRVLQPADQPGTARVAVVDHLDAGGRARLGAGAPHADVGKAAMGPHIGVEAATTQPAVTHKLEPLGLGGRRRCWGDTASGLGQAVAAMTGCLLGFGGGRPSQRDRQQQGEQAGNVGA